MTKNTNNRTTGIWIVSFVAIIFGLMTLKEGGLVLFGPQEYEQQAGNYVAFVLWFNFIAGFFYIVAGVCLFLQKQVGIRLAIIIALSTVIVFVAFAVHIFSGGEFETRTLIAMSLRSLVWIGIAVFSFKKLARY